MVKQQSDSDSESDYGDFGAQLRAGIEADGALEASYGSEQAFDNNSKYSGEDCVEVEMPQDDTPKLSPEERKKQRRIALLDKRIKAISKKQEKKGSKREKFEREASEIKNKHKRQEVVVRRKMEANSKRKLQTLQRKKLREELGEEAVPKGEMITIEKMRVPDETMVTEPDDEDLRGEQAIDEFDKYFNRETTPKILVTTNRRPNGRIFDFLKELKLTIPNLEFYPRKNFKIRDIIEMAKERDFTDIMVF